MTIEIFAGLRQPWSVSMQVLLLLVSNHGPRMLICPDKVDDIGIRHNDGYSASQIFV
jgi:hypothetical protein